MQYLAQSLQEKSKKGTGNSWTPCNKFAGSVFGFFLALKCCFSRNDSKNVGHFRKNVLFAEGS